MWPGTPSRSRCMKRASLRFWFYRTSSPPQDPQDLGSSGCSGSALALINIPRMFRACLFSDFMESIYNGSYVDAFSCWGGVIAQIFQHDGPPELPKSWWPAIWKSALNEKHCGNRLALGDCLPVKMLFLQVSKSLYSASSIFSSFWEPRRWDYDHFAPCYISLSHRWSSAFHVVERWLETHVQIQQKKLKTFSNKKWSLQTPQRTSWQWLVVAKSNAVWPPQMLLWPQKHPKLSKFGICLWHVNPAIPRLWNFASLETTLTVILLFNVCMKKWVFERARRDESKFEWRKTNLKIKTHSSF